MAGEHTHTGFEGTDHGTPIWYADDYTAAEEAPAFTTPTAQTAETDATRTLGEYLLEQLRRERFGGINWGAAFLGSLAAVGLGLLLIALIGASIVGAVGLTNLSWDQASDRPELTALAGAALGVAVALIACFAGGYVAGRMTRYDGDRQGLGVWLCTAFGTLLAGTAGGIVAAELDLLDEIDLSSIPIDDRLLLVGAVGVLFAVVLGSRSAATLGGKAGRRYHQKVDAYGSSHPSQAR